MNITFISLIKKENNDEQKIEFTSLVTISKENDFTIYEFKEPGRNIMNRIEISELFVNIFAGPNSINLALDRRLILDYQTPQGIVYFESETKSIDIKDKLIKLEYNLYNQDKFMSNYKITLKIG